jgi:hypothetical protein
MLNFQNSSQEITLSIKELKLEEVKKLLNDYFISAIGHDSTAKFLSQLLEIEITANRIQVNLKEDDLLIVAQLLERLPEGKILTLEEIQKFPIKFFQVKIKGLDEITKRYIKEDLNRLNNYDSGFWHFHKFMTIEIPR